MAAWRAGLVGSTPGTPTRLLTTADGTLAFAIRRTSTGLLIERRHCPMTGARTALMISFESEAAFDRWCDCEPIRFDEPTLHARLRREGHEVLASGT